jgi:6-phospho-3-hexuloisomerase
MNDYGKSLAVVMSECQAALEMVDPKAVERFIELLLSSKRIFFVGTGRVMLSLRSIESRLGHLGLATYHVGQTGEPPISKRDLLVVGSGSGESIFPVAIALKAQEIGVRIVHIGSNPASRLSQVAGLFIRIPAPTKLALEGEVSSMQPFTSLFEQCLLLFGDIVAQMLIDRKHLTADALWLRHANLE